MATLIFRRTRSTQPTEQAMEARSLAASMHICIYLYIGICTFIACHLLSPPSSCSSPLRRRCRHHSVPLKLFTFRIKRELPFRCWMLTRKHRFSTLYRFRIALVGFAPIIRKSCVRDCGATKGALVSIISIFSNEFQ